MSEHIQVERDGALSILRIARPQKKNALTRAMYEGLVAGLEDAEGDDEVRVVLIRGEPGIYTAGNDLMDFMQDPPKGEDSPVFRFLLGLAGATKPIVSVVDGPAVGIGTTLLMHTDLVYASERARFHMPFINLGLVPEGASSFLLPRLAGYAKANEMLMFGEPFDAQAALQAGLVNEVLSPDVVHEHAVERARALAERPPEALAATKRLIRHGTEEQVRDALRREGAVFMERLTSPEAMAAFQAFFAK